MAQRSVSSSETRWQKIRDTYHRELLPLLYNRAVWFFCLVWLASLCYVLLRGKAGSFIGSLLFDLFALILAILTIFITQPPPIEVIEAAPASRQRLWVQIAVILFFILFIGYYGMVAARVVQLPFISHDQSQQFINAASRVQYLINVILYFVLPMAVLLLLKVRWQEVGFGRGYYVWRVVALWGVLPLIGIIVITAMRGLGILPYFIVFIVKTLLQAGFVEEFLFRGALLSRLRCLIGTSWGIVCTSLLFGLWHLGTNLVNDAGGDYLAALAFGIFSQALLGVCFAVIFLRTRNLIAPSIAHVSLDILSSMFG